MANCDEIFSEFNRIIRLDDDKRINLKEKRNNLRDRVLDGFVGVKSLQNLYEDIEFQSQGSFVMDTIINPYRIEDEYDIDDGVYFLGSRERNNRPEPKVFHDFIINSIKHGKGVNEIEKIHEKDTCVRVSYKGKDGGYNYHVDIPIYYAVKVSEPDLADKKEWWHLSNPIEFIVWFENIIQSGFDAKFILESKLYQEEYEKWLNDRRKKDHQLRRIVRYLKAWGDFKKGDMPPGVVMTILAGENYNGNIRDDISLHNTLKMILDWLDGNGWKCPRPTTPVGEDLFKNYPQEKKAYFRNALMDFINSSTRAIQNPNSKDSCLEWQKHLGHRFPCHLAKDEKDYSLLSAGAAKSDMWFKS